MTTPFDRCGTLAVTSGRVQNDQPGEIREADTFGGGRLFLVVTPSRRYVHFCKPGGEYLPPHEVNQILKDLGVSVRVDSEGRPYTEDGNGKDPGIQVPRMPVAHVGRGTG